MTEETKPEIVAPKAILSLIVQMHHSPVGEDGTAHRAAADIGLLTDESCYCRTITVGKDWQPVTYAHLESCSCLVLENRYGQGLPTQPTLEERKAIADHRMEVCFTPDRFAKPVLSIPPKFGVPLMLDGDTAVYIRTNGEEAKIKVTVVP